MKKFLHVYQFELGNYFNSKTFLIPTILICVLGFFAFFIPGFFDKSSSDSGQDGSEIAECIAIYDTTGLITDELIQSAGKAEVLRKDDENGVKEAVEKEEASIGFVVKSEKEYDCYVFNKEMFEEPQAIFSGLLSGAAKAKYCAEHNINAEELAQFEAENIVANETILGKDSSEGYWYSYILVIAIFMIIVMYGMMIATSVANEKSNRTVEILVTSTSSTSLLFGKVFAGATAIIFQVGVIFAGLLSGYHMNQETIKKMLPISIDIPTNILVSFAIFGLGGFLLYAFLYGALGALVSKIEDLNKSAGTAQMMVMVVYFLVLFQMQEPDGMVIKVLSYLPISSYSAMFIRIAMGKVELWEIILSGVLLYASIVGMGFLAAKIFRNSTLRYGNPIKISSAIKELMDKEK